MTTEAPYRQYLCVVCGYIYDEAEGDPDSGLAPGTRFEDIPDDWYCPLCGVTKADFEPLEEVRKRAEGGPAPARRARPGQETGVVVVGAGVAGWSTVEALRRQDPDRPVTLVAACSGAVYPKPQLSTAVAQGRAPDDLIRAAAREHADRLGIRILPHTRVRGIDREAKRLRTAAGSVRYTHLVLATGARQRRLPLAGDAVDQVLHVNDLRSYRALRARVDGATSRVVILGGGLIGCELGEDLAAGGHQVTIVDPTERPLARLAPEAIGEGLATTLGQRGITFHGGDAAAGVHTAGDGLTVTTHAGDQLEADVVLSAAGLVPAVELAREASLEVGHGIQVDTGMQSSDPAILAVGDGAEVNGHLYAYIDPIREQAEAAAATIAASPAPFCHRPPLIRVKTPSLPLALCPPETDEGHWERVAGSGPELHLEFHDPDGRLAGFALSGDFTREAAALNQRLYHDACPT